MKNLNQLKRKNLSLIGFLNAAKNKALDKACSRMIIKNDPHPLERAAERGATDAEIRDTLQNGIDAPAKRNRMAKIKIFPFGQIRNGKHYPEKRVEVIYLIENEAIITITVYVFYGKWEV